MEKGVNKMSKFRSYNAYNTNFNDISVERRTGDKIAEVNRNVNDIHSDILRLNIMCQALMEILVERGVDPDVINSKIFEIMDRPETFDTNRKASQPCPQCGRLILDNGTVPLMGTCFYCGTVVKFPPVFKNGEENQEATEENPETQE